MKTMRNAGCPSLGFPKVINNKGIDIVVKIDYNCNQE